MAQATLQPKLARRSLPELVVDRVWRFFCSVRVAIWEIAILSVLVFIGTLRGSSVPEWIASQVPALRGIVDRWYAWDVFRSFPFMFMLALLSVAIAICTINRAPGIWRTIAHPTIPTSYGFLRSAEVSTSFERQGTVDATVEQLGGAFKRRGYRMLTEVRDGQTHLYADRHRFTKLGTFPFHLALILMLIGGIVGARFGFRENEFIIPEGSVREVGRGTGLSIGLVDFRDTYLPNGQSAEYRSELVIYKNGAVVKEGAITVNNPITYEGVTIYQASFGPAVALRVTDQEGRELFNDAIAMGIFTSRLNPDAPAGILELPLLNLSLHVIGPDSNRANEPELDTLGLRSGEIFVQARPRDLPTGQMPPSQIVAQGDTITLEGVNIEFLRERQFTLLQVASNPGMPIFWAASFLLIGGLAVVFYFPHRRVRGIVSASADGNAVSVMLAPLAKRDWSGQRDFTRIAEEIARSLSVQATVRQQGRNANDQSEDPAAPATAPAG